MAAVGAAAVSCMEQPLDGLPGGTSLLLSYFFSNPLRGGASYSSSPSEEQLHGIRRGSSSAAHSVVRAKGDLPSMRRPIIVSLDGYSALPERRWTISRRGCLHAPPASS